MSRLARHEGSRGLGHKTEPGSVPAELRRGPGPSVEARTQPPWATHGATAKHRGAADSLPTASTREGERGPSWEATCRRRGVHPSLTPTMQKLPLRSASWRARDQGLYTP